MPSLRELFTRSLLDRVLSGRPSAPRARARKGGATSGVEQLEVRLMLSATSAISDRLIVDPPPGAAATSGAAAGPVGAPPFDYSQTFLLNSRAGASKTIYLDFDGHTTANTPWNTLFTAGAPIVTPAYSIDGIPTFNLTELESIQRIWLRVAEDFAPFDVNVTTQDPGLGAIIRSGLADNTYGTRVVIGGSFTDWFLAPAGGVAFLDSFGESFDNNCFAFSDDFGFFDKGIAEVSSHEAGHTLGLSHDGTSALEYYPGHGFGPTSWAPIMGDSYTTEVTQWSRGEYTDANNQEDDLFIITTQNGFGYRPDDFGSTRQTASVLPNTDGVNIKTVSVSGVIEQNTDQDWFSFTTTGGPLSLTFTPAQLGANLDIQAQLFNANGVLITTNNPSGSLGASINIANLAAGTYYVAVDGVGFQTPTNGYSDYGSLGQYSISGTFGFLDPPPPTASIAGRVWHDKDGDGIVDAGDVGLAGVRMYFDNNNNGVFDSGSEASVLTNSNGNYVFAGLVAGSYRVRQAVPTGFQQIVPTSNASRTVTLKKDQPVSSIDFRNVRPPSISSLGGNVSYRANTAAILLTTTASVSDLDTTAFNGGRLVIGVTNNVNVNDRIEIRNQGSKAGQINVVGSSVRFGTTVIGTRSGGSGTTPLTIQFNNQATQAAVTALLRNITFRNISASPPLSARTIQFQLLDGTGGISTPVTKQVQFLAAAAGAKVVRKK